MIIIPIILIIIVFYVLGTYNKLVSTRTRIKASIQEIGNQLKRQADLIPNLVESVKGFMKHEKGIFEDLTNARKVILDASGKNDAQSLVDASSVFEKAFGRFQALVESTPEIKSAGTVTKLMDELRDTADKLMYSRRTLIDLTADYNIMIVTFPNSLVAGLFKFKQEKGLEMPGEGDYTKVSTEETKTPKVSL